MQPTGAVARGERGGGAAPLAAAPGAAARGAAEADVATRVDAAVETFLSILLPDSGNGAGDGGVVGRSRGARVSDHSCGLYLSAAWFSLERLPAERRQPYVTLVMLGGGTVLDGTAAQGMPVTHILVDAHGWARARSGVSV